MYTIKVKFENPEDRFDHTEPDHEHHEEMDRVDHEDGTTTIRVQPGRTLLEAAVINNFHLNHNCGAVCACTTCHIYLEEGEEHVVEISDKEEDYVDRARMPKLESRLGCQCELLEGSGTLEMTIPDQSDIIGHEH